MNRLGLRPSLARCPVTTNIIESPHSGVRLRMRRLRRWRDGESVPCGAAAAPLLTEKDCRRIRSYRERRMQKAARG